MNKNAVLLSIAMGVVAVVFISSYINSIQEEAKRKFGSEVNVVVAKRDIKEMEAINETMLEQRTLPKAFLEPSAIALTAGTEGGSGNASEKEKIQNFKSLVGTVALVALKKGEQITYTKITDPSVRTGLSTQVAPGKRAISVPVDEFSAASKLVKPGDRVDLIAVLDGGSKETKMAKTLFQDVVLLSIGRYVTNNLARSIEADNQGGVDRIRSLAEDFSFSSVTLELTPMQAQQVLLILGYGEAKLFLSLRNNDDVDPVLLPATMLVDVLGGDYLRIHSERRR